MPDSSSIDHFPWKFQRPSSRILEIVTWNLRFPWELLFGTSSPHELANYGPRTPPKNRRLPARYEPITAGGDSQVRDDVDPAVRAYSVKDEKCVRFEKRSEILFEELRMGFAEKAGPFPAGRGYIRLYAIMGQTTAHGRDPAHNDEEKEQLILPKKCDFSFQKQQLFQLPGSEQVSEGQITIVGM